jgi:hypothetical protein
VVGNPRKNALFSVVLETRGLRRLGGGRTRARTWDPMIRVPVIICSINDIRANRSDKASLITLRYCRQCKLDFEAFTTVARTKDRRGAQGAPFVPSTLGHLSGYVPKDALPSHGEP